MCTSLSYKNIFGRNLDYDFSYGEGVVITPKNYPFEFKYTKNLTTHSAIIGIALIENNYPLYFDAINEYGLYIAGLNFVGNAKYFEKNNSKINVTSYELIPYLLTNFKTVSEIKNIINDLNITNDSFNDKFPPSELHWMISDSNETIVLESTNDGLKCFDNPYGVLTNNPPFEIQSFLLNNLRGISNKNPINSFNEDLSLKEYSRGMGAFGIPGDLSSSSRFLKIAFTRNFSLCNDDEISRINQFFHILHSVEQQRGCCEVKKDSYEITLYSSAYSIESKSLYFTTYDNHQISKVSLENDDLNSNQLKLYNFPIAEAILNIN